MKFHRSMIGAFCAIGLAALLVACGTSATERLVLANQAAATAAAGITVAADHGLIKPGSEKAEAIKAGMDSAEKWLDQAGASVRAGNDDAANTQIDAAESQLQAIEATKALPEQPEGVP